MIQKLISSGYTGPEKAALDAALKYGIPHAGWIHYIRGEDRNSLLEAYNLKLLPALDPRAAVRQNISLANGTLILATGKLKPEPDYARHLTLKRGLQLLGIDPRQYSHIEAASLIAAWVDMHRVSRIYVIGSDDAELGCPYRQARKILDAAVTLSLARPSLALSQPDREAGGPNAMPSRPSSVSQAVDRLIADLFLKDKTRISAMDPHELDELHPTLGGYIKEAFGLLSGNDKLVRDCMQAGQTNAMLADEAAALIIKELWKKLQTTHKLRIV